MNDLVSIIMPSYNTAKYIGESIESVLSQTYHNWELIIIDDCSNDNTDEVIAKYLRDERIRYYKNEVNSGAAISRNRALREAKGRWIAFLDSDDLWEKDKLEKQINFMENNDYSFSYTKYCEIDENSNPLNIIVSGPKKITKKGMYRYCWPGCLTVMYDAKVIGLIQIEDIKKNNDYAMWLQIIKVCDCYLLDKKLASYRKRKGSISRNSILIMIAWHYKLFYEVEHMSELSSLKYLLKNMIFGYIKKYRYKKRID